MLEHVFCQNLICLQTEFKLFLLISLKESNRKSGLYLKHGDYQHQRHKQQWIIMVNIVLRCSFCVIHFLFFFPAMVPGHMMLFSAEQNAGFRGSDMPATGKTLRYVNSGGRFFWSKNLDFLINKLIFWSKNQDFLIKRLVDQKMSIPEDSLRPVDPFVPVKSKRLESTGNVSFNVEKTKYRLNVINPKTGLKKKLRLNIIKLTRRMVLGEPSCGLCLGPINQPKLS